MESAQIAPIQSFAKLSPHSREQLKKLNAVQEVLLAVPQIGIPTSHLFHAGMYARKIELAEGVVLSGAEMKIPTMLLVSGDVDVYTARGWERIVGSHILIGSAHRKQIFVTRSRTTLTMIFPTSAKTVEEAEREFTDEHEKLMSRKSSNDTVVVTGE